MEIKEFTSDKFDGCSVGVDFADGEVSYNGIQC